MTYIFLNNIQGVLPFDAQFTLIRNLTFETFSLSLGLFTIPLASETMKFRRLFKSSIISLHLGKYMVNIVYEVLFSSTLAHKKFSICLTCNVAVHRYFLQLSKSSLCLPFLRKRQILAGKKNFFVCSEIRKTKMALEVFFTLLLSNCSERTNDPPMSVSYHLTFFISNFT